MVQNQDFIRGGGLNPNIKFDRHFTDETLRAKPQPLEATGVWEPFETTTVEAF